MRMRTILLSLLGLLLLGSIYFAITSKYVAVASKHSSPATVSIELPANEKASQKDFSHSITLYADSLVVRTGSLYNLIPYDSLNSFISQHKSELSKYQLNIIVTEKADYKRVVDILDQMAINRIKHYKLLSN